MFLGEELFFFKMLLFLVVVIVGIELFFFKVLLVKDIVVNFLLDILLEVE